ncbi:hypothetical protein [Mucilaginibacter gilvus]|uniref:Uncharacterized protein n=1 Tax=Mucilaginibacter gilvus TaxID=2305909 RepID=A0A444MSS7_9SPHI|nr:hypothetical protein [Mucilaginibacter gilvus]RWY55655.1 hypothetical protein EPL05_04580 [Mucilaginibacter gilvus]
MKNKKTILTGLVATALFAALGLSSAFGHATTLSDLRAKAVGKTPYCTPASDSDCQSSATGNIYAGYKPGA